ncbi:MAG: hypothetical protein WC582_05190 [Patescibacteria group bacterium]
MSFCCHLWPNCDGCPRLPVVLKKEDDSEQDQGQDLKCSDAPTTDVGFGQR